MRLGDIAQSVRCLGHKYEELSLNPQYLHKVECKTSLEEGTYEPLKLISQQVQPNCLATGSVGDLVSRHKAENNLQSSKTPQVHRWPAYAHSCKHTSIHMYTHLCAHAHTHIHNKNGSPSSFTKMSEHRTSSPSPLSAESAQPG